MKKFVSIASIAALGCTAPVFAHGSDDHGKPKSTVIKSEQKELSVAGDAKAVERTIKVGMGNTMRFTPQRIEVTQGETIKFVIANDGEIMHEFVIGAKKDLDEHAALMMKFPNMEHDEPYLTHVAPGTSSQIIWTFNRAGNFDFAWLIAGHYQAGMVGKIKVVTAPKKSDSHGAHKH